MESSQYFWLRSTGFPIHHLTDLGRFADLPACRAFEQDFRSLQTLKATLLEKANAHSPQACRKFIRKLNENQALQPTDLPEVLREPLGEALQHWNALLARTSAPEEAAREYDAYLESARQGLIDFLDDEAVAEALFISNPSALTRIRELIRDRHSRNDTRKKQKLRLGWSYAQRFCAKNDTSSFFGPLAWGRFDTRQTANVHLTQDDTAWIKDRHTFFENWVVQRLVEQINQQCPDTDRMPLQLNTGCYLHEQTLFMPIGKSQRLNPQTAQVLQYISEQQDRAATYAGILNNSPQDAAGTLRDLLEHLVSKRIVRRGWQMSPRERHPIVQLQRCLANAGVSDPFNQLWQSRLEALEGLRRDYAHGDLMRRTECLERLNQLLGEAGVDLSRETGAMYVGRYPLYEDCSRNMNISLGQAMLDQINQELAPLMRINQWLIKAIAHQLNQAFIEVWEQRQVANPGKPVDFLDLLNTLAPLLPALEARIIGDLDQCLETAWAQLLQDFPGHAEVRLCAADVERLISLLNTRLDVEGFEVFGSDFHSPDILLSSASVEAFNRGDYQIIVGEVHPAVHTLSQPVAAPFGPFNTQINQQVEAIFQRPRLVLADSPESYQRSHIDWPLQPSYLQLVLPSGGGCVAAHQQFAAGRAKVLRVNGRLQVVDALGQFSEDLLCVYSTPLHRLGFALAGSAVAKHDHRRIWLGRTLYKRASWLFARDRLPEPKGSIDELEHTLQWRAWAGAHGLPRYAFVKIDTEPKPLFLDFDNPLSFDGISNALKNAGHVKFSEMRPCPDELWLEEARGRFCCEIRTTFSTCEALAT
ncbi:lantibiotic dehydratase family protein [Pseudomonas sp. TNT2022 ID357]|uniref:Lantibiotic dehydratase family protein n=1 Tax=Pseudomonas idahonensis TaxID=2942628 RepID=A0ABT5Q9T6_9PSED|nr:lantibiotic dehydratase [Pseudomonas idahonensis]MDD1150978.1 lantibiotic dehydratase family protein [Pseudomonas idahonensis]